VTPWFVNRAILECLRGTATLSHAPTEAQVRLAAAVPAMLLTSFTYLFVGVHHWQKGVSLWAVTLDTGLSAALALPIHLTAVAIFEVRGSILTLNFCPARATTGGGRVPAQACSDAIDSAGHAAVPPNSLPRLFNHCVRSWLGSHDGQGLVSACAAADLHRWRAINRP